MSTSVRGCRYCCSLPVTMAATAPMVMNAENVRETSAADQPESAAIGLSSTLQEYPSPAESAAMTEATSVGQRGDVMPSSYETRQVGGPGTGPGAAL